MISSKEVKNYISKLPKNTKKRGRYDLLIYKEGSKYVGVNLQFDIVEEADDSDEVLKQLQIASKLHAETVIENDFSDDLLNRYAPDEYWKKLLEYLRATTTPRKVRSPYQIQDLTLKTKKYA